MPVADLLEHCDRKEALSALSAVATQLLPEPTDVPASTIASLLLTEARSDLKINNDDNSSIAHTKLVDLFAQMLTKQLLPSSRVEEVVFRLGNDGELRPNQYKVAFTDQFREGAEKRGAKRSDVERIVEQPDRVQHLYASAVNADTEYLQSLFTKTIERATTRELCTVLVQATRKGNVQSVTSVWRIYHSDVDLNATMKPLDMLSAFVDVYGLDCTVG